MYKFNFILTSIKHTAGLIVELIKRKTISIVAFVCRKAVQMLNWFLPGCSFKAFVAVSLHAIWMIVFSLLWLVYINMFDGFEFMNNVMDYRDLITKNVLKINSGSDIKTKYLLINTSANNQLLAADNDNQINTVITDRIELIRVLRILNNNSEKIKYLICDIFFGDPDTIHDKDLQEVISSLDRKKKIVIPFYIAEGEELINYPIIEANNGLAQYRTSFLNTQYLKFSFISYDTLKHIPLVAYEDITGNKMVSHKFCGMNYFTMGNRWCLNTIIPEFRYTSFNIIPDSTVYDLGLFSADLLGRNQIVFIGDFEGIRDRHHSMIDEVAGPLIVINALESLMNGDNMIKLSYLLLLFFFFIIISYHTFYKSRLKHYVSKNGRPKIVLEFLRSKVNYILILVLSLVSMLFYHHYIHLFILLSYFALIELVMALNKGLRKNRKLVND